MDNMEPSTPDVAIRTLVEVLIRHILSILATAGVITGAALTDSMITVIASALIGIATVAWALWDKVQAKRKDHANSVASARAGLALEVK